MDPVGFADGFHARLRQADAAYLSGFHQFGHGAHGILDGRGTIDAMLIVKIDAFDIEPLQ